MWNLDQQVSVHMPVIAQWYAILRSKSTTDAYFL